jgi:alkylresorcinol/alkylpyrone synthase
MYLLSVASAFPDTSLSQSECWELLRGLEAVRELKPRSRVLMEKILTGDSGIGTRQFAAEDPLALSQLDAEGLHRAFERHAPALAARAVLAACEKAGVFPRELDALMVCTCTGYLCPGVSSYVAERLGIGSGTYLHDMLGMGCGAAVPMLQAARGILAVSPGALVATVAVEICSAAFYVDDEPGVLISVCLFGDGAAAALWRGEDAGGCFGMRGFRTVHLPEHREKIRFVNAGGKLKNQLDRTVPALAAAAVGGLFDSRAGDPDVILCHTGGRDVIDAVERRIGCGPLAETRRVLREHGNISSPSVLVALENHLESGVDSSHLWLAAFGAGFAAHSCELVRG